MNNERKLTIVKYEKVGLNIFFRKIPTSSILINSAQSILLSMVP